MTENQKQEALMDNMLEAVRTIRQILELQDQRIANIEDYLHLTKLKNEQPSRDQTLPAEK
jgi:hypothetical protein